MFKLNRTSVFHRLRFSTKSLLLLMTLLSAMLAMFAQPLLESRRHQRQLDEIVAMGANISSRGSIQRDMSLGHIFLSFFSSSYSRFRLYYLDFSNTKVGNQELEKIAKLQHIQDLNLQSTQVTDEGLVHLQKLRYLRKLNLSGTQVTDRGLKHLSEIKSLLSLHVERTNVCYAALEEMDAAFPIARFCEERAIEDLKAAGVQVVHFSRHHEVELENAYTQVMQAGEEASDVCVGMNRQLALKEELVLLNYLTSVRDIVIHSVTITPGSLAEMKRLPKLKELSIYSTNIIDSDLEGISTQTQLESLIIHGCQNITGQGLLHLKTLKNLKELRITSCGRTDKESFSELIEQLPDCKSTFQLFDSEKL